ncbi:hypothetical protein NO2_1593 [Candidatus Termititenax persephonae]|uniref:Phage tail fiber protein n=1 Tax=Candidatus Termititenax persephonae TaxID=2218525 RepID=A0A388TJG4_9BACT|nr:hypothetical protein NO2_1593 [Candidatus Termititenax persephonae]
MANDYGDQTKYKANPYNIDSEKKITASGMRQALGTKEDVANKKDTLANSSAEYPSSAAVYAHTSDKNNPHGVTAAQVGLGNANNTSDANKPISTATQTALNAEATARANADTAINTALSTEVNTRTNADTAEATARATADAAINTALNAKQASLPVGTILMYKGTGWVDNSTLLGWYACTSANTGRGCPNLVDKFLRGGSSSGAAGGADSQSITLQTANLPAHNHGATGLSISGLSFTDGSAASDGAHEHDLSGGAALAGDHEHSTTGSAILAGGHSHGITEPNSGSGHRHQLGHMDSTGGTPETVYESGGLLKDVSYKTNTYYSTTGITINNNGAHTHSTSGTAASAGAHIHDFTSTSKASSAGAHTHSVTGTVSGGTVGGETAATGSGTAFTVATVPSYYTVIYIMRVN